MKNHKEQFPIIRFHTYRDEWKQHKLGEVFEQTVEYVDPYEQNLELWSVTVESGLTPKEERYNREFLVKKSDKFKKLYPEEIVYNPMNITIGAVGFNNAGKEVAVSGYYVTMKMKSKFSNNFFSAWLSCPKAIRLYKIYSTGSLIERQRVQFPTLSDIKDYFPIFDEQSAIGSLFRTLDDLLSSYKDNLTNYQALKATMLSKMFPKAGQTVPEIRLNGFDGEWEEKELGDIVKFYSGLTYKPSDVLSCGTLVLRSSNVRDGELIYIDNVFVNPNIVNCQNVKSGDIVVVVRNGSRDLIGKHALIRSEMPNTVIGAFMTGVRCDNPEFINALLDTKMFISEIHRNLGSTINQITTGNFKRMKFYFPLKDEQQAIGAYFSNLDNLINSYQEKISQLETLKKKLLQDMFI